MEIVGKLVKQDVLAKPNGESYLLQKPIYTFIPNLEQENYCCEQTKSYIQGIKFAPNYDSEIASSMESSYFTTIHGFRYCPSCSEPFTIKVVKYTKYIQIKKVETTYQFVEIDDDIKIEQ